MNTRANGQGAAHRGQRANPLRPMRQRPRPVRPPVAKSQKDDEKTMTKSTPGLSQYRKTEKNLDELRKQYGGWSEPPPQHTFTDIPILTTKKSLLEGVRYHLMKFSQPRASDNPVDPADQDDFTRPVTLHRRDARQPPPGRAFNKEVEAELLQVDDKEVERLAHIKAEREAQRAVDQAKIAPVAKESNPKRPKKQKEEKTSFNRAPKSEAAKKESDIRYEEALPWHLEDADGKNVWVGNYVAALSESNVAFMIDKAVFRMVPLEKWYKFTAKPPFQPFTLDQAEAYMSRKVDVGRWVMKDEEKKAGQDDLDATRRLLSGRGQMVKTESATFKAASRSEKLEHDELDVSGDEFQDDDETPYFERMEDVDAKESKERIRREQLGANLFGDGDEKEVDKELRERLREELERQKYGKSTKKALIKRDREDIYESDKSEENPWSSSSDDGSSDEEEADDKDEERKDADPKEAQGEAKEKLKPGGLLKGSVTPQGKFKHGDAAKKTKTLKRSGSPVLSESSGNESSRKKMKKTAATAPGSRSTSPALQQSKSRRNQVSNGSSSDGEATGGDMSDTVAGPKKALNKGGSSGRSTPSASRAVSPNLVQPSAASGGQPGGGIEPWEILEKIPEDGISLQDLVKQFHGRVGDRPGQMVKSDWIRLVKQLCDYGQDKRLRQRR